ncbi:hypothetical protein PC123_g17808 [Phytophthora cactorum]|nr:hypothetical protein PC123_g17808 [Phytophthora cactorum]
MFFVPANQVQSPRAELHAIAKDTLPPSSGTQLHSCVQDSKGSSSDAQQQRVGTGATHEVIEVKLWPPNVAKVAWNVIDLSSDALEVENDMDEGGIHTALST